jgi:UDP-glucose:(heptosyl)LPS alpha-1,3-glucosyltransferase
VRRAALLALAAQGDPFQVAALSPAQREEKDEEAMNIALCHESVLPQRGGCETYVASLARRLAADGHHVHLYARYWDASALPEGLPVHLVEVPRVPRFLRPWFFSAGCRRLLARADHDVSVGFDKVAGVDVLYPQGGVYAASVDFNLLKHRSIWLRRLLRASKAFDPAHLSFLAVERQGYVGGRTIVVAISDMVRRHLAEHYQLAAADVRVLPIAAPRERLDESDRPRRREESRRRWELRPDDVVALFAGMNYRLKGLESLLHALARLPRGAMYLLVAGKQDTTAMERLAARLGVGEQVRFLGYCPDMRDAYFAADLLAHPTFYDPCSNVVLEALACGLPVVTSRYNGAAELLGLVSADPRERAEGYVVDDPHDHARLAWCLERMLDPVRRAACARAARQSGAGWTFEGHYRKFVEILAEAAGRRRNVA